MKKKQVELEKKYPEHTRTTGQQEEIDAVSGKFYDALDVITRNKELIVEYLKPVGDTGTKPSTAGSKFAVRMKSLGCANMSFKGF